MIARCASARIKNGNRQCCSILSARLSRDSSRSPSSLLHQLPLAQTGSRNCTSMAAASRSGVGSSARQWGKSLASSHESIDFQARREPRVATFRRCTQIPKMPRRRRSDSRRCDALASCTAAHSSPRSWTLIAFGQRRSPAPRRRSPANLLIASEGAHEPRHLRAGSALPPRSLSECPTRPESTSVCTSACGKSVRVNPSKAKCLTSNRQYQRGAQRARPAQHLNAKRWHACIKRATRSLLAAGDSRRPRGSAVRRPSGRQIVPSVPSRPPSTKALESWLPRIAGERKAPVTYLRGSFRVASSISTTAT
mmetsp:Transcript_26775/g.85199  ORF Transcript_26775/g.85199 Transcript_26775/m.85199 type:complete len:309 (-) Transcript_26775:381-1307(-)